MAKHRASIQTPVTNQLILKENRIWGASQPGCLGIHNMVVHAADVPTVWQNGE